MTKIRAAAILAIFLIVTLTTMPWQLSALKFNLKRRKTYPRRFHTFICWLFGIRVKVIGTPVQDQGVLMVGNHTSWLDIPILSKAARISFIAKAEVASWPFFSTLAKLQETVYVERTKRSQTGQARDQIRERLLAGDALMLFPEGTSSDGNQVLPFKSALMGAVEAEVEDAQGRKKHVLVQPVSTAYVGLHGMPMGRENRPLFAWYGDMDLVPHLWEFLNTGPIDVVVEYHKPISIDTVGDRKKLAKVAEDIIRRAQTRALAGLADAPVETAPSPEEIEALEPAEAAA
jgi:1-acyl-sn-glycerol-3-phosphate acyltransferase